MPTFPGDDVETTGRRCGGRVGWITMAVLTLLAGGGIAVATDRVDIPFVGTTIATVRMGTAWNVRGGPGMGYGPDGVVHPGQLVVVSCSQGNWVKLTSPVNGFIYHTGLDLRTTPRPC